MPVFGRVVTAMATPFHEDGSLDLDGAQRLATHLVDHGTDTVLVNGTTGESPTLEHQEVVDLARAVKDAVGARAKVMLGTGSNATARTVRSTAEAADLGADAVLVVTPYYNKPNAAGQLAHFRAAAEATELPVLLYDVPGRTAQAIPVEVLVELSQVDNIVGVKDATADLAKASLVIGRTADAPGGFELYSGADEVNLPLLSIGAAGFVSVLSHLIGDALQEMATVFPSDPGKAREIHNLSLPLQQALFAEPSPGPLKGAMNRLGLPAGPVRGPLAAAPDATVDAVLAALEPLDVRSSS